MYGVVRSLLKLNTQVSIAKEMERQVMLLLSGMDMIMYIPLDQYYQHIKKMVKQMNIQNMNIMKKAQATGTMGLLISLALLIKILMVTNTMSIQ